MIQGFQNVVDAAGDPVDAVALQKAVAAERAAFRKLEIVRGRLRLGDINYLGLLSAQQTYQQAVLSSPWPRRRAMPTRPALFAALGGGWWNRQDVAPEKPVTIGDFFQ